MILRIIVALVSGQPIPAGGLSRVLFDSLAAPIRDAKQHLRMDVALLGSGPVPTCGLDSVLRQASHAFGVHRTEPPLAYGVAVLGECLKPLRFIVPQRLAR